MLAHLISRLGKHRELHLLGLLARCIGDDERRVPSHHHSVRAGCFDRRRNDTVGNIGPIGERLSRRHLRASLCLRGVNGRARLVAVVNPRLSSRTSWAGAAVAEKTPPRLVEGERHRTLNHVLHRGLRAWCERALHVGEAGTLLQDGAALRAHPEVHLQVRWQFHLGPVGILDPEAA